jgi:hypothetical protein
MPSLFLTTAFQEFHDTDFLGDYTGADFRKGRLSTSKVHVMQNSAIPQNLELIIAMIA